MTLFNRVARLDVELKTNSRLIVENLRISFQVEKTEDSSPNKASIEIYNLSEDTRNKIRDSGKMVILYAGYTQNYGEEIVFIGDIVSVSNSFSPPDIVTEISAIDGKEALSSSKISVSESTNASALKILEKILSSFSIGNNLKQISVVDKRYIHGFVFSGFSKVALDKVCKFLSLVWSVQNNRIVITKFDSSDTTTILSISKDSGLIGTPSRVFSSTRKAKGLSLKETSGWSFECLLIPSINPKSKIFLKSKEIKESTAFTVISVTHSGDTHGQSWSSSVEVKS